MGDKKIHTASIDLRASYGSGRVGGQLGGDFCLKLGETSCAEVGGGLSVGYLDASSVNPSPGVILRDTESLLIFPYFRLGLGFLPVAAGIGVRFGISVGPGIVSNSETRFLQTRNQVVIMEETASHASPMLRGDLGLVAKVSRLIGFQVAAGLESAPNIEGKNEFGFLVSGGGMVFF